MKSSAQKRKSSGRMASKGYPNPIDVYVGNRIRMRRAMMGLSQSTLAEALGLTFQQVQKYERGANRVSASKLYEIAAALRAPVAYFFDGLADPTGDELDGASAPASEESTVHSFLMTAEGLELAKLFPNIAPGQVRRRLLELVRSLADEDAED